MKQYVADTHALFWYLAAGPRLSANAKAAFDEGARGEALIHLPSIVIAELYYLNEKLGRPLDFAAGVESLRTSSQFVFVPLMAEDALDFDSDAAVPEMHDRIIVGVTRRVGGSCITLDPKIAGSGLVTTLW